MAPPIILGEPKPKPAECFGCQSRLLNEGFAAGQGQDHARIMLIGEALGDVESRRGFPFCGGTGKMLRTMLKQAKFTYNYLNIGDTKLLNFPDVYITNTVKCRPWEVGLSGGHKNRTPTQDEITTCTKRYLTQELERVNPNVIVPVGDTALRWLFDYFRRKPTGTVTSLRGYLFELGGRKILPIVHPSYVAQGNPEFWAVTVCDLVKARLESATSTYLPTPEKFIIEPSIHQVFEVLSFIRRAKLPVALDFETLGTCVYSCNIMCLGLAWSNEDAICVPLLRRGGYNYWNPSDERAVWGAICELMEDERVPKITQNGFPFDLPVFQHLGVHVQGRCEDTLMMHHNLYSELPHSLEFLSSLCVNKPPFKGMAKDYKNMLWAENEKLWLYNCRDVVATWAAWKWLSTEINEAEWNDKVTYREHA